MKKQIIFFAALLHFLIANKQSYGQYCVAPHVVACSAASNINDFTISGTSLSNTGTGCTATTAMAYTIYPPSATTTATLLLGQTYTFNVTITGTLSISLWIDFDHNNTFDATEWTQMATTASSGVPVSIPILIPTNAVAGPTGLRIRARAVGSPNGAPDACLSFGSGETEDYTVTLDPGVPCAGAPLAGTAAANDTSVCPNVLLTSL